MYLGSVGNVTSSDRLSAFWKSSVVSDNNLLLCVDESDNISDATIHRLLTQRLFGLGLSEANTDTSSARLGIKSAACFDPLLSC